MGSESAAPDVQVNTGDESEVQVTPDTGESETPESPDNVKLPDESEGEATSAPEDDSSS